jgi:site-specific recombinase XerD
MQASPPLEDLLDSFELSLRAKNRSPRTFDSYKLAALQLSEHVDHKPVNEITRRDVESYLASMHGERASATVRQRYASLKQVFKWLEREDEIENNPITGIEPPTVDEKPVPIIPIEDLRGLLAACKKDPDKFAATRDEAIIRLFMDTGLRLGEMTAINVDDVDLRLQTVVVFGKGRRFRTVAYDIKSAETIDRYKRRRKQNPNAHTPHLWLGRQGQLTDSGIVQVIRRRSRDAGIEPAINPHRFRHTASHQWLTKGGNEGDLQRMMGWSSPQMIQRYGSAAAEQRSIDARKRIGMWDDI